MSAPFPHHSLATTLEHPMNRRRFLAGTLALAPAALLVRAALPGAAAAQAGGLLTTTDLNLREGPGTGYRVLLVIPAGAHVSDHGVVENGFRQVAYANTRGWASAQYLAAADTGGNPGDSPVVIGSAVATVDLNLRAGPGTNHQVLRVLARGTTVQTTDFAAAGYRYVIHEGLSGWVAEQYLGTSIPGDPEPPYDPNYATTTADVNLRSAPSLSASILAVIPSGTRVRLNPEANNNFRGVEYNGANGWVRTDYLN